MQYCSSAVGAGGVNAPSWTFNGPGDAYFEYFTRRRYKGIELTGGSQSMPGAFINVPSCAADTEGMTYPITDSTTNTWGATITGSGGDHG